MAPSDKKPELPKKPTNVDNDDDTYVVPDGHLSDDEIEAIKEQNKAIDKELKTNKPVIVSFHSDY